VDDVISEGTAKREAIELIRAAGAEPAGILLALDRQERGAGERSAIEEVEARFGVPCVSIVTLDELIEALSRGTGTAARISAEQLTSLQAYRDRYGARPGLPRAGARSK
jgi:orotate phosphoribosyltransferase